MRNNVLGLAAALCLLAPAAVADPMPETFSFIGDCADCSGQSMGTLVVNATTPGQTSFGTADFVSFTYTSNLVPQVDYTSADTFSASFDNVPGEDDVVLFAGDFVFQSQADGFWCIGFACGLDFGPTHLWSMPSTVVNMPEPGSVALIGVGMVALAVRRRYAAVVRA